MSAPRSIGFAFVLAAGSLPLQIGGCWPPPCEEPTEPASSETFTINGFGTITTLGTLGPYSVRGNALDNSGQIAGWAQSACSGFRHAMLWQDGEFSELGTLGGGGSRAVDINESGEVVGESGTGRVARALPIPFPFPWVYLEEEIHGFVWDDGTMTSLGTLPAALTSGANAINDQGQVVGWAGMSYEALQRHLDKTSSRATSIALPPTTAVLWERANGQWEIAGLGSLGGLESMANDINSAGQVVGWAETGEGSEYAGLFRHAFLWSEDTMQDLGTLGGAHSEALAINDAGQVVGWAETADGADDPNAPRPVPHAFLWQDGKMIDLGTLGGEVSEALDINEVGQVVGWSETAEVDFRDRPIEHAFLWRDGEMTDLNDRLPADSEWEFTSALAINDAGQILGAAPYFVGHDEFGYEVWEPHSVLITLEP